MVSILSSGPSNSIFNCLCLSLGICIDHFFISTVARFVIVWRPNQYLCPTFAPRVTRYEKWPCIILLSSRWTRDSIYEIFMECNKIEDAGGVRLRYTGLRSWSSEILPPPIKPLPKDAGFAYKWDAAHIFILLSTKWSVFPGEYSFYWISSDSSSVNTNDMMNHE